jgi:hypothetical protein
MRVAIEDGSWRAFDRLLQYFRDNVTNCQVVDAKSRTVSPALVVRVFRQAIARKEQYWQSGARILLIENDQVMLRFVGPAFARFRTDQTKSEYKLPLSCFWELVTKHFDGLCIEVPAYSLELEAELKQALRTIETEAVVSDTVLPVAAE